MASALDFLDSDNKTAPTKKTALDFLDSQAPSETPQPSFRSQAQANGVIPGDTGSYAEKLAQTEDATAQSGGVLPRLKQFITDRQAENLKNNFVDTPDGPVPVYSPAGLQALYAKSPEKAQGWDFNKWLSRSPTANAAVMKNPLAMGFAPGEGLARSPIAEAVPALGIKPPPVPVPEVVTGDAMARRTGNAIEDAAKTVSARLGQDIAGSGKTAEQVMQEVNEARAAGKPVVLADIGENLRGLTGNVARQPGEARNALTLFFKGRGKGTASRVAGDINSQIASGSSYDTVSALDKSRGDAASPLYEEAFTANQNVSSPKLDRLLQTPAGSEALAAARKRMQNKMSLMGVPDKELMEQAREAGQYVPGGKGVASGLKLKTWDLIKQDLDEQIGAVRKKYLRGEAKQSEVTDLQDIKNQLVSELDRLDVTAQAGPNSVKPEGGAYKRARAAYSGPSRSMDAVEEGERFLKNSAEENRDIMANLSPGDREFFKLGAANTLRRNPKVLRQLIDKSGSFGNDFREKIRPLFNSDADLDRFARSIETEINMAETSQKVIGGSPTEDRAVEDQYNAALAGVNALRGVGHAASGNWLSAARHFMQARRDLGLRTNALRNLEISRLLTDPTLQFTGTQLRSPVNRIGGNGYGP